ncbi:PadR family transcriptional regulator [Vallicoccus soli]|uniref:PadR family transcriptional regulator n=1 Tax=Vallicoccus soli TaxID=2339232 RepID=A0A3A3Z0P5_9ACTN|nr:helix-turn-helix transcriptional regulator [Vallicoccus soli]RJK97819.1 PadR family transcriptional regulator [Vallicoccus soli]
MNATSASLLGLLDVCGGELTGGELVRTAQERLGEFWTLTRSQVYRELAVLERDGHVAPGTPGPRDARPYRVTPEGVAAYRAWMSGAPRADTIRIPLLLTVAFGRLLPPDRYAAVLDAAREEHAQRLAGYRALDERLEAEAADAFARATLSFGLHYEEAVLRWFDALPTEVRRGVDPPRA